MAAHLQQVPVPPIERDRRLPAALNDIILMAIEKDPAKRFQSAGAMLGALRAVSGAGVQVAAPAPVQRRPRAAAASACLRARHQPAPLPAVKPAGRRGLYMALGALAAVGVIVIAAIEIPSGRRRRRRVLRRSSRRHPLNPHRSRPTLDGAGRGHTAVAGGPAGSAEAAGGHYPGKTYTGQPASSPARRIIVSATPQQQQNHAPYSGCASEPAQIRAGPRRTVRSNTPAPNPADTARQASLAETREHLMLLGTRAVAVKTSINSLRAEQNRMGLGLRADISAGLQRMEYFLDQTEDALKRGDADAAKKNLSNAERETGKLESFLGR